MGEFGRGRSRLGLIVLAALALCATVGITAGAAEAKKKKKAATTFQETKSVNAAIPDDAVVGPSTPVISTITVGKKFKGKVVGDVNVTGIRTTGTAGASPASNLDMQLISPGGRMVQLLNGVGLVSIGPLTLDDDTQRSICNAATPTCEDPDATLLQPFAGTANMLFLGGGDTGPLSAFNGTRMKGTWTATIWDEGTIGETSTFNSWGLKITAAKRVTG